MFRILAFSMMLCGGGGGALAAPPFACQASGETWSVVGHAERRLQCNFTCILHDAKGNQDAVSCAPAVSDTMAAGPVCEGFITGRHWTSAVLVTGQCATSLAPER